MSESIRSDSSLSGEGFAGEQFTPVFVVNFHGPYSRLNTSASKDLCFCSVLSKTSARTSSNSSLFKHISHQVIDLIIHQMSYFRLVNIFAA